MRWTLLLALLLSTADVAPAQSTLPPISLPEMLAIELPTPGMIEIAPTAAPLAELLGRAQAQNMRITHDVARPLRIGSTRVTWTATNGTGATVTRSARVYVFPFGQTPVGVSRSRRATGGNNAPKIVRDFEGRVHMVWLDAGRPNTAPQVLYRRAATDAATGTVTWETAAVPVSTSTTTSSNAYAAIRASARAIHIVWQTPSETICYRRFLRADTGWTLEPIRDTQTRGVLWDKGPGLDVRGDDEIHVVSPTGQYAVSRDGGASWSKEALPAPASGNIKGPALALDAWGNSHVIYTVNVRGPAEWSSSKPNHGYGELRYVRRTFDGTWVEPQNVLAGQPAWADPRSERDVLADWPDITVDGAGHVHVAWHGTVNTHIFGRDEAFYVRRPILGAARWGAWEAPQALVPRPLESRTHYSYAPSLSADASGELAIAITFVDVAPDLGQAFDSVARFARSGRVDGARIPLATWASSAVAEGQPEQVLSAWFPSAAPRLYAPASGRAWLDVLQTLTTTSAHNSPYYIVYQRVDMTTALRPRR